ncbi:alpha-E domain-containing protein [Mesorhizobium marinum]|uniref:alpha-E domain-containing protein n=1 Tax=Mesorhizobium marinum TaxID=3228790 RepID=UPI003F5B9649
MWLGRYIERSEDTARILRAYHVRLAETSDPDMPLLADMRDYLARYGIEAEAAIPEALIGSLDSAAYSAGQVRDRFSPDGWLALRDLSNTVHRFAGTVQPGDDATRAMTVILRKLAGFSGLLSENMYRFTGWRFLEIGRRLERAIQIARSLAWLTREDAPDGALDMMLEIGDSVMTHRRQYASAGRRSLIDLLALDPLNPRSVLYQLDRMKQEIAHLPESGDRGHLSPAAKDVLRLHTALATDDPADLSTDTLDALADDIAGLYSSLARAYFA